jgi:hypothetical protein
METKEKIMTKEEEIDRVERYLDWYLGIGNEYNRRRLVTDEAIVNLIDQKLVYMEEEY